MIVLGIASSVLFRLLQEIHFVKNDQCEPTMLALHIR